MFSAILLSVPPVIPFVSESPVVDGLRTDAAWAEALVLDDLRVIEPNVGFGFGAGEHYQLAMHVG